MFAVYDLTCNGLRDACGVSDPLVLSWRLASDRRDAVQRDYRIVVTSMADGSCKWDTATVQSSANKVIYGGEPLTQGETCVWFVSVTDDAGERADGAPSSFVVGHGEEAPSSFEGAQRRGLLWTSDAELDDRLDKIAFEGNLDDNLWQELLGLSWEDRSRDCIRFWPEAARAQTCRLSFAQGSLLLSRGLLVARWERHALHIILELLLPPGVTGVVGMGAAARELKSGRYEIYTSAFDDTILEERDGCTC